jgi:hypothetical protein
MADPTKSGARTRIDQPENVSRSMGCVSYSRTKRRLMIEVVARLFPHYATLEPDRHYRPSGAIWL